MSRFTILFAIVALIMTVGAACNSPTADSSTPPPASHVLVGQPELGVVESTITLPGDLVGYYQSALYAKVTGYLKAIYVDKGDWVKAGQVLAVIEVPELQQRLDRSQASLEIALLTYQRLQTVWKSDPRLVARQDVDIAYAKYQEAKATADELNVLFSYTRITAPYDGVITARLVDPGALIHAGGQENASGSTQAADRLGNSASPVVSIARLDKLRIYLYVPQGEVGFVRQGMPATVTVQGIDGARYSGTVVRFAHSLDLATRTMLTEVDLENPNHRLYPGMYANVTLVLQRHTNALRVPAAAVGGEDSHEVFVVRDGQLQQVRVSTGIGDGRHIEITAGLNSKDLVVQTYSNALQQGEHVTFDIVQRSPSIASAD